MPLALVVSGAPATGKTTLGAALARDLGTALIDLDTATAPLISVVSHLVGTDDLDDPRLGGSVRVARYETVTAVAEDCLRAGTSVVLVAPFTRERQDPAVWCALAARLTAAGGEPRLVWISLPAAVAEARLKARGAARDKTKAFDGSTYPAGLEVAPPQVPHVIVQGESSTVEQVSVIRAAL